MKILLHLLFSAACVVALCLAGAAEQPATLHRSFEQQALTAAGDAKRGRELFANETKTKCAACHKVNGQGGEAGPDLTHIGGKFDRPHLIESLLQPSRQIVEGFRTTVIRTADGSVLSGIVKEQTEQQLTLYDAAGKKILIRIADIQERKESPLSLMPQNLVDGLTTAEFCDLVAYLETLRTGEKPKPGAGIAGPLKLPAGFSVRIVASGLTGCTAMCALGDGRLLVCEQTGALRVIKDGVLLAEPMLRVAVDQTWERGLIGVTVAPDFPSTPQLYVCYVAKEPFPHHRISRFKVEGDRAIEGSEQILLRGDDQRTLGGKVPAGHQGGGLHFGTDGKLYIGIGEQTAETPAQSLTTFQGKILRLNLDGSTPSDNPLLEKTAGKYQAIWALGLRNPFTFAVRPTSGELFINDVGGKFEELNIGVAGANYGWPTVEHGPTSDPRFQSPLHYYPQASISGGDFCPQQSPWPKTWQGDYFFADFVHGWLKRLNPDCPDEIETVVSGLSRPVDLRFSKDGKLYILLRNAWVIDDKFVSGTSALLDITCTAEMSK